VGSKRARIGPGLQLDTSQHDLNDVNDAGCGLLIRWSRVRARATHQASFSTFGREASLSRRRANHEAGPGKQDPAKSLNRWAWHSKNILIVVGIDELLLLIEPCCVACPWYKDF